MILLDYKDNRPLYEQVTEKFQELMLLGVLEEDSQMPSVRSLAVELSINPNTIQRAYSALERDGYLYTIKGRGSFVGNVGRLKESRKQDLLVQLGMLAGNAVRLGITRDEFVRMAETEYDKGGKQS